MAATAVEMGAAAGMAVVDADPVVEWVVAGDQADAPTAAGDHQPSRLQPNGNFWKSNPHLDLRDSAAFPQQII